MEPVKSHVTYYSRFSVSKLTGSNQKNGTRARLGRKRGVERAEKVAALRCLFA